MSNLVKKPSETKAYAKGLGTGAAVGAGATALVLTVGFLPGLLIAGGAVVAWKIFKR